MLHIFHLWKTTVLTASRTLLAETEWSLNQQVFDYITQCLGYAEIDIFASMNNNKCQRYISWLRDPGAEAVDAFTIHWGNLFFYAFPLFSQILRTLQKIISDRRHFNSTLLENTVMVPIIR